MELAAWVALGLFVVNFIFFGILLIAHILEGRNKRK